MLAVTLLSRALAHKSAAEVSRPAPLKPNAPAKPAVRMAGTTPLPTLPPKEYDDPLHPAYRPTPKAPSRTAFASTGKGSNSF